jgi:hypothetical protein
MHKDKHLQKRAILKLAVFGVGLIIFVALSFVGLAHNSNEAKQRYDRLIAVDQSGGDVEKALNDLRSYIYSHMNTQIGSDTGIRPPIQLQGTYERLVQAEEARVAKANETLYQEAQADCERRQPAGFSGSNRLECIEAYVDANGVKQQSIEDDFYKFDFAPPVWSMDLAGISIALSVVFSISFIVELIIYQRVKNMVTLSR